MSEQPDIPLQQNVWLSEQGRAIDFFLVVWGFLGCVIFNISKAFNAVPVTLYR